MLYAIFMFVLLCSVHTPRPVYSARIKIAVSADSSTGVNRINIGGVRTRRATPACADKVQVAGSKTGLPSEILDNLHQRVRFFSSNESREFVDRVLVKKVDGLGETTVQQVFNILRDEGCYPFFYGGVVRDIFLNKEIRDVDVEANCHIVQVVTICNDRWGVENCDGITPEIARRENTRIAHIGKASEAVTDEKKIIDLASTNLTFYGADSILNLEYTANSLAYDSNNGASIILDIPHTGIEDVCEKKIRIPSDDDSVQSWENWKNKSIVKLYRFWKLRAKGFTAIDNRTSTYIITQSMMAINEDEGLEFKKFYCKTIYAADGYDSETDSCLYNEDIPATCESSDTMEIVEEYNRVFSKDFGSYWDDTLKQMLPQCQNGGVKLVASLATVVISSLFILLLH